MSGTSIPVSTPSGLPTVQIEGPTVDVATPPYEEQFVLYQNRLQIYANLRACVDLNDLEGLLTILHEYEYLFVEEPSR